MGTHKFEIIGYNLKKGMGIGNFVQLATFTIGNRSWVIRFYPEGVTMDTMMFASIALVLMDKDAKVRAFYNLLLVNQYVFWIHCDCVLQAGASIEWLHLQ
jgi:speckle-type POZ protein